MSSTRTPVHLSSSISETRRAPLDQFGAARGEQRLAELLGHDLGRIRVHELGARVLFVEPRGRIGENGAFAGLFEGGQPLQAELTGYRRAS